MRAVLALCLLAAPVLAGRALAETPLTGEEFEALVEGRTLTYGALGAEPYGVEHYHDGRRVTWAWLADGVCHAGEWYAQGPPDDTAICFVYAYEPTPKCWKVFREGDAIRAVFLSGDASVLYEIAEEPGGLVCGGVGV